MLPLDGVNAELGPEQPSCPACHPAYKMSLTLKQHPQRLALGMGASWLRRDIWW